MTAFNAARLARIEPWPPRRLASGVAAGAVTLLAGEDEVHILAAGPQDIAAGTPMRAETIFRMLSTTKPMVAALAVMLIEDGAIALDDAVAPMRGRHGFPMPLSPRRRITWNSAGCCWPAAARLMAGACSHAPA